MAPSSFRMESLAALLVARLEASRRAWIDDPKVAEAEIRRISAETAASMARECREVLGDDAQATRLEREAVDLFVPRYTRLAVAQNQLESGQDRGLLFRIVSVVVTVVLAIAMERLGLWVWLLPLLTLFFPELQTAWSRRAYEGKLQQIVNDLAQVQDTTEHVSPAAPVVEPPRRPVERKEVQ